MVRNTVKNGTAGFAAAFLALVIIMFLLLDAILTATNPVGKSTLFRMNDFEKTIAIHGTTEFDSIIYGSSPVVAGFKGAESSSGYVEFGLVYGKITYLLTMLEKGHITVDKDIVLGLSITVFMDQLDTDPRYIWHKSPLEPYLYFYRDRVNTLFSDSFGRFLDGDFTVQRYTNMEKLLYHGVLSDEKIDATLAVHEEKFWGLPMEAFEENLAALERLIVYCGDHGIRLRALWMPCNPYRPAPEIYDKVISEANVILAAGGIEIRDMTHSYPREYFYDIGHLNYEVGAEVFTREIDIWLAS